MKSPFPGMDPHMEPHWRDVQTALIAYSRDDLNERLPSDLVAAIEERIAIEDGEGDVRVFQPPTDDLIVVESPQGGAVAAPYRLSAVIEPLIERYIRVIEAGTERLITVIEFVSPANKRGEGLAAFRAKRADVLNSGANFVEIDLVRAGDWQALLRPHRCPRRALTDYRATFRVPAEPQYVYLHPIALSDHLPSIPIPLRPKDPELRLDLQPLLDRAYANGRYERRLDYRKACEPPLSAEEAAWSQRLLSDAGRRGT